MAWIEKRLHSDGKSHSYRVHIRKKGKKTITKTFKTSTQAKIWAKGIETEIHQGKYKVSKAQKYTFGELADKYLLDQIPRKSRSRQTSQVAYWKNELGDYRLCEITPAIVVECRDRLSSGMTVRGTLRSPSTVVRYLALLSHMFTIAIKDYNWTEENPVLKISKPKEPRGRVRFLDEEEMKRLLSACQQSRNPYLYVIVVLAISTGMRKGEIMNLKWTDINLAKEKIILQYTKNGEIRPVALKGRALELIKQLRETAVTDTWIFPNKTHTGVNDIGSAWENALAKAEVLDFRFHDLRHTAASYLIMGGASQAEVAEVLGHKTFQMVKRYAHMSEGHTATVIERMNERIFQQQ